jgi:hypothetical protein
MLYFIDYLNIDNTKYEKIFESTMRFLKKVYQEKINSLKNTPIKYEISDNFSTLELAKYTEETFLEPESILQLLRENNQEFTNLNDYKEIIESVLNNGGSYQLTTEEKEYYRNIFNKLLTTNSFNMICNSANYKTLRTLSLQLYTQNINELHGSDQEGNCEDFSKYLKKYKDIIQVIENN